MNLKKDLAILVLLIVVVLAGGLFYHGLSLSKSGGLSVGGQKIGQAATYNGVTIVPLSIIEDSRCPVGVQCIWAGTVKVNANVAGQNQTLELSKPVVIGDNEITLTSVGNKGDYRFEFNVQKVSASNGGCYVGGCSGQICSDQPDVVSTCEYTPAYACYKTAKCERQATGQCGWTETAELRMCLNNAVNAQP